MEGSGASSVSADSSGNPPPQRLMDWQNASRTRLPDIIARRIFGRPLAPTAAEWSMIQEALWTGDPPMDNVVNWMFSVGPKKGKMLFEQALTQGIDAVIDPPDTLKQFFAIVDRDPPWLDRSRLDAGAKASHLTGKVGFFVLRDLALMGGYAYFNSMNQTLAGTGALNKVTRRRLGETAKWYNDVTGVGGMSRFGEGFQTTLRVRLVHALVRRTLNQKIEWDHASWGLPINQVDMLATYLAFGPVTLMGARPFGVFLTKARSRDVLHMWRYIGWLMGVEEQWLSPSMTDGLRKLHHCSLTHRLPDEKIRLLGEALRDEPLLPLEQDAASSSLIGKLGRWLNYQQHMSNSSLILMRKQRHQLGLPVTIFPWYPLLSAPFRFMALSFYQLRGGSALDGYAQRLRNNQEQLLKQYFGDDTPDIIKPGHGHPAHV